MLDKLQQIENRFTEVGELLTKPETMADMKAYARLNKEYKDLKKIVDQYHKFQKVKEGIAGAKQIISTEKDAEFREMAKMELDELHEEEDKLEAKLKVLLIPKDPRDSKDSIIEILAGAGGDEAAIFAGDLMRMYQRFAENMGWKLSLMDFTDGTSGGYKEIICPVTGEDVYGKMRRVRGAPGAARTSYRNSGTYSYISCQRGSITRDGRCRGDINRQI